MKDVSGSTEENSKKPAENSKRLAVFASRHKKGIPLYPNL